MMSVNHSSMPVPVSDFSPQVLAKLDRVKDVLSTLGRVVIAYSGGVDSTLVAKIALDLLGAENVLAVIASSASFGAEEEREALETINAIGLPFIRVETDEVDDPRYAANPTNRCYFCKEHVYGALVDVAQ